MKSDSADTKDFSPRELTICNNCIFSMEEKTRKSYYRNRHPIVSLAIMLIVINNQKNEKPHSVICIVYICKILCYTWWEESSVLDWVKIAYIYLIESHIRS